MISRFPSRLLLHILAVVLVLTATNLSRDFRLVFPWHSAPTAFVCFDFAVDGPRGWRTWKRYRSDDGALLWFQDLDYADDDMARAILQGYVQGTSAVLEAGERQSADNRPLGRYAVVSAGPPTATTYQVVWVVGSHVLLIDGPTRAQAETLMRVLDGAGKKPLASI
jgi:hypothetical protein